MPSSRSHETVVGGQFGSRADAYLKSAVHAAGEDLQALNAPVTGRPEARVLPLGGGRSGSPAGGCPGGSVRPAGGARRALMALVTGRPDARVLDLGCGGGPVTFNTSPHVAQVTAYALSPQMLDVVAKAASERGLA